MMCTSWRNVALLFVAFIFPPVAVLIARNRLDSYFWLNVLLSLLAWLPGWLHASWVVLERSRGDEQEPYNYPTYGESLTRPLTKDMPPPV